MMKAKEMFEELGFRRSNTDIDMVIWRKKDRRIVVMKDAYFKETKYENINCISSKESKAITKQMEEIRCENE